MEHLLISPNILLKRLQYMDKKWILYTNSILPTNQQIDQYLY